MMELSELKQRVSYQTLLLAGFALLASALLGLADYNTRDVIKLRLEEDLQASLAEVIPDSLYDNKLLEDTVYISSKEDDLGAEQTLVYLGRKQGKVNALSFRLIASGGYSGPINLIMGLDKDGKVLGVRVIAHAETPGLGDKIEVSKSNWILNFEGHSLQNLTIEQWAVKKDGGVFDQFSGATITPRAIVKAVYRGLKFFENHRAELLAA
ncbi:MAG: electron transport complex subunit RsxG [Gammaproteobacteria bacterium]